MRSGWISLTAPTSVVLPTPKPPATRILIAVGQRLAAPSAQSARRPSSTALNMLIVGHVRSAGPGLAGPRISSAVEQVAEQHPDGARPAGRGGRRSPPPRWARWQSRRIARCSGLQPGVRCRRGRRRPATSEIEVEAAAGRARSGRGSSRTGRTTGPASSSSQCSPLGLARDAVMPRSPLLPRLRGPRGARYWPTRVTSMAISYAIRPMSASCARSTARQAPCPPAVTKRNASPSRRWSAGPARRRIARRRPGPGSASRPPPPHRCSASSRLQPGGGRHEQAVGGQHDRLLGLLDPADQIVEQPGRGRSMPAPWCHVVRLPADCVVPMIAAVGPLSVPRPTRVGAATCRRAASIARDACRPASARHRRICSGSGVVRRRGSSGPSAGAAARGWPAAPAAAAPSPG